MQGSLYIVPEDPFSIPPVPADVEQVLRDLAIIGDALDNNSWQAADGFARHVVFAGCSPYLVFDPPGDGSLHFCHLAIHGPYPKPVLVTGQNHHKPRCPLCRNRFSDWNTLLADWLRSGEVHCPKCSSRSSVYELDWRQHAVAGRYLIELRNVFPGEAAPSDRLLLELEHASGLKWTFGWGKYHTASEP